MPETIKDGRSAVTWKINENNRGLTSAISIDESLHANKDGDAYNFNTKNIALTNTTDTPVLYLKNNESRNLHIRTVVIGLKASADATETQAEVTFIRNPTAGTIISSPTNSSIIDSNRNYGASKTIDVNAYKGATGDTLTDGEDHIFIYSGVGGRTAINIDEILPQGKSIGVNIKPPAGNTSLMCYVAVICHFDDIENK